MENFVQLGEGLDLTDKQIKRAFKRIKSNTSEAIKWIQESFLSKQMKIAYKELLEERYNQHLMSNILALFGKNSKKQVPKNK